MATRCVECFSFLPTDEMIRHGNVYVCINCKPRFLQKLAEGASLPGTLRYAGFWRRFLAVIIDGLVLIVVNLPVQFALLLTAAGTDEAASAAIILLTYLVQILIGAAYESILIWKFSATVGKMVCQVEVLTAEGKPLSLPLSIGRYFAKMLSSFTLFIGFIMAAFDIEKRSLHDRICGTRVVMK